ncbi:MAG TPA: response regulator [Gemmatimonadales bacterium]|nr:response regulator [Gemmatimonadales bacterium]
MECWSAPVVDINGRVVWAIVAFSDITLRRQSEEELRHAKTAAEAANHAKSDFLAKMSHELRTPLNSIIGFSEMLEDESFGPLNEKQRRYVNNVLTSGRNLLQLINDILDLSKVEAGHMQLALSEFDIALALSEVQTIVGSLVNKKHLRLDVEVEEGLPALKADQAKVKQVLYNLLSNAIKFTPEGGSIRVTGRSASEIDGREGGRWIEISVADTGIGLRVEDTERIFGEFEQVDSGYTRNQEGTGLGLALSRKLVELHGGWIWVESELAKGSIFRFVLPAGPRPVTQVKTPRGSPEAAALEDGPLILVVEDNAEAGDLLEQHLRQAGYRVAHATTGERALVLAEELGPDGITLDILLPDRDGLDVLAELKANPKTRAIPVVIISITQEHELGDSLGAADWLVKPTNRDEFIHRVRRALAGVVGAAGAESPKVLIVDDEVVNLELLTDMLTRQGFRILTAHSGGEGIAIARAERPDLIVLDLLMPETSGFDVVRELRAAPESRDIPILIFTVKDLTPEERERLRGHVQAVVRKGASADLLRELTRIRADQQEVI